MGQNLDIKPAKLLLRKTLELSLSKTTKKEKKSYTEDVDSQKDHENKLA